MTVKKFNHESYDILKISCQDVFVLCHVALVPLQPTKVLSEIC